MIAGTVVLVIALAMYLVNNNSTPVESTPEEQPMATTTDIFDMEPIVPEAKVSTEGWKTCRNEEYGYEFQFPGEWHIYGADSYSNPPEGYKRYIVRESQECNGPAVLVASYDVTLSAAGNPDESSIRVLVRNTTTSQKMNAQGKFINPSNIREVDEYYTRKNNEKISLYSIDNINALLRLYSYPQDQIPNESWNIDVFIDALRYEINLGGRSQDPVRDIHETILSTFRFLDKENTSTEAEV